MLFRSELGLSAAALCERVAISQSAYSALETMREKPIGPKGWRLIARKLADFYFVEPDELFPPVVCAVEKAVALRKMDGEDIAALCMGKPSAPSLEQTERVVAVHDALSSLRPRERDILARRFGIGRDEQTMQEIAAELGVSRSRVMQIEANALRHMRQPSVSKRLAEHRER